ncbi:MAG TPA: IS200/IS605 family transposase [Longimicrobium sp.]|jgi:REP element-mobilizing transposase RayT|uniref:IS200/IS605 family transposase n=1 Tax=Longimicrobium sp. TaxID=2029185 RepID=UPI002EDAE69C
MRHPWTELYVHLVWATWNRHPLITPALQPRIYAVLHRHAHEIGAEILGVGGMPDHVHVLARFPANLSIATLVQRLKGASSYYAAQLGRGDSPFKWQGGYGAFTLSKRAVPIVRAYIANQEAHHRGGTTYRALERIAPEKQQGTG